MPPRYAYWTILVDGGPTAFRAAEPDELLPTLKRLQVKQPDAVMKWFEKGRLWDSRDDARDKLSAGYTVGKDGELVPPADGEKPRTKSWRPGGEHKDPREKYQLAKKAKWQAFKKMVRSRPGHGPKTESEDVFAPFEGDEPRGLPDGGDEVNEPRAFEPEVPGTDDAAFDEAFENAKHDTGEGDAGGEAPRERGTDWRGRPKPEGGAPRARGGWSDRPKPSGFRRDDDRPRGPKPAWRDKPQGEWRAKPGGTRPAWKPRPDGDRPPRTFDRDSDRPRGPKPEWRDRGTGGFDRGGDRPRGPKPEWRDRGTGGFDRGGDRPRGPKPEWRDRGTGGFDRGGDRPRGPKPEWRDRGPGSFDRGGDRPRGPKPEWRDRGPGSFDRGGDRPRGPKPEWRDRGPASSDRGGDRPRGPKPEWRDRAPKPFGDRPRGPKPPGGGFSRGPRPGGGFGPKGRSGPPKRKP